MFLLTSKLASVLVTLFILIHTKTDNDALSNAAQTVTSVSTVVSSIQTALQVILGIMTALPVLSRLSVASIRRGIVAWLALRPMKMAIRGQISRSSPTRDHRSNAGYMDNGEPSDGACYMQTSQPQELEDMFLPSTEDGSMKRMNIEDALRVNMMRRHERRTLLMRKEMVMNLLLATERTPAASRETRLRLLIASARRSCRGSSNSWMCERYPRPSTLAQ